MKFPLFRKRRFMLCLSIAHKIETWFLHHNVVCHVLYFYNSDQRNAYRNLCMEKKYKLDKFVHHLSAKRGSEGSSRNKSDKKSHAV